MGLLAKGLDSDIIPQFWAKSQYDFFIYSDIMQLKTVVNLLEQVVGFWSA